MRRLFLLVSLLLVWIAPAYSDDSSQNQSVINSANSQQALIPYREKAFRALFNERISADIKINNIRFTTLNRATIARQESGIIAWMMVKFQKDIVDLSKVTFLVKNAHTPSSCHLYIREDYAKSQYLHINLHACVGALANKLSGEDLSNLTIKK